MVKNFSRYIGSIFVEIVSINVCFESWSGYCFGQKLGAIGGYILDTSVVNLIV